MYVEENVRINVIVVGRIETHPPGVRVIQIVAQTVTSVTVRRVTEVLS